MRRRWHDVALARLLDGLTYLIVCLTLLPTLWLVSTAFKTRTDAFAIPPVLVFVPTLDNFRAVLSQTDFLDQYLNSMIVASNTTILALAFGVPAAYALTRFRSRWMEYFGYWTLAARLLPPIGMLFPLYVAFNRFGLLDTYGGLIVLYLSITVVFVIWLMRGYFLQVPLDLEDAAHCDGATRLQALWYIVMPLAAPGTAAVSVLTFLACWNEFMYALILTRTEAKTVPVAVVGFMSFEGINWGQLAAAGLLVLLPVFLLSVVVLKHLVAGLAMGAIKE